MRAVQYEPRMEEGRAHRGGEREVLLLLSAELFLSRWRFCFRWLTSGTVCFVRVGHSRHHLLGFMGTSFISRRKGVFHVFACRCGARGCAALPRQSACFFFFLRAGCVCLGQEIKSGCAGPACSERGLRARGAVFSLTLDPGSWRHGVGRTTARVIYLILPHTLSQLFLLAFHVFCG